MSKGIINVKSPTIVDSYYEDEDFQKELDKISDEQFLNGSTMRTIKNIKKTLVSALKKKYGLTNGQLKEVSEKILKIHGLDAESFDSLGMFEPFMTERTNDLSIDDNSNKNEKTIAGLINEVVSPNAKLIGYDMLYRVMKELYGSKEAKILSGDLYDLSLGLSDATKILLPYCWALDASKLVIEGRKFGQLPSKPAKRVDSYIAALNETVHQMSSHLAGAIAVGTFFLDIAHLLMYKERVPFSKLKEDKEYRKYMENQMQKFVHSVNHLSRNGVESPFTNISIFDRSKLAFLIGSDNYGWYFPNKKDIAIDNGLEEKMNSDEFQSFVIDYIMELQEIYEKFHEAGDPSQNGIPYRFPVVTMNISKNENDEVEDEKFLKDICKLDISRFNIFTSGGTKIASCCRLINDKELLDLGSQVNSFGGTSIAMGSHRVCTINFARIAYEANSMEDFYKILDMRIRNTAKILKAHKILIGKLTQKGLQPFITRGWIKMDRLFSTFGILGVVECKKILEEKFADEIKEDEDVMHDFLVYLNDKSTKYSKELGIFSNIEQIPGESFAIRLATADKLIFNENIISEPMYANQFVPLWKDATLWERLEIYGKYDSLLSGGGIVHAQIGTSTTSQQNEKIIREAIRAKCEHFALNRVYTKCKDCEEVFNTKVATCPHCGSLNVTYYTRTIGYFTPVDSWSKIRREWEFPQRKFVDDSLV
nr:MAG TPA: anaerobic ribonucleoside triphosphate reductase [Caudoviricetes sp.]